MTFDMGWAKSREGIRRVWERPWESSEELETLHRAGVWATEPPNFAAF